MDDRVRLLTMARRAERRAERRVQVLPALQRGLGLKAMWVPPGQEPSEFKKRVFEETRKQFVEKRRLVEEADRLVVMLQERARQ